MTNGKLKLRTAVVVPFVLQIMAAVGLVGFLAFRSGQRSVNNLSTVLRSELAARINQSLATYLTSPHDINQLNAAAFLEGDLNFESPQNLSQMLQQVEISPFIFGVYCGTEKGEFLGVGREAPGNSEIYMWVVNANTSGRFLYYDIDRRGNRLGFVEDYDEFDSRQRPWYEVAMQSRRAVWSEVYLDFTTLLPTITASRPVYSETGQALGVCATDLLLPKEFRSFLSTLDIGKTGEAFVMDRSGQIISSSTDEPLTVGEGEAARLIQATASREPLIRETATYLRQHFGSWETIRQSTQLDFKLNGKRQFIQVMPFNDGRGLDWLIVVVIPEADFMADINASRRSALGLSLGALGLALGLGLLTARWLTQPIKQVSEAAAAMAEGDLDQTVGSSKIQEINRLSTSFNSMSGQLKETFAALSHSEARNRALLHAIPDLMLEISAEGVYLDGIDAKTGRWQAVQVADQVGKSVDEVLPAEIAAQYQQAIQQVLQTHVLQTLEYHLQVEAEDEAFEARVVPCSHQSVLFMVRNITDRKQSAEALLREKIFSDALIDSLPGIFYLYDKDMRLVRWNKQFEQVLRYSTEEAKGIYALDVICEADRPMISQRIEEVFAKGESIAETRLLTKCGDTIPYVLTGRQIVLNGITYLLGSGIDISEQKRAEKALRLAEQNYRSIFENALEGVFQSSLDGRFISVNPAMAKIYGYSSPAEMVDSITDIAIQVYVDPSGREFFKQQMNQQDEIKGAEYRIYRKDGSIIWVEENARAVRDDDGNLLYYEGIVQDITQRKQLEAQLKQQVENLRIEIDQQKRAEDVAEITQSGYFQEVQEEIAQVDLEEFWG